MTEKPYEEESRQVHSFSPRKMASRARYLIEKGGISEIARGVRDFSANVTNRSSTPEQDTEYVVARVDNDQRREFIFSHIPSTYRTLLDIGCAEGYFTTAAVEHGLNAHGIEGDPERYAKAVEANRENPDATFEHDLVTPDNIDEIGEYDVILLLTVFHHWVPEFGYGAGREMLQKLGERSRLLVFEPPGNKFVHRGNLIYPDESVEKYSEFLLDVFDNQVEIVDVEMFDYMDKNSRRDPIFIIDTSTYNRSVR